MSTFVFIEPVATWMFGVRVPTNPTFTPFGVTPPRYVSNERPGVNPWRHAYTRRKHFEFAADAWDDLSAPGWHIVEVGEEDGWVLTGSWYASREAMFIAYLDAADNADWGTR